MSSAFVFFKRAAVGGHFDDEPFAALSTERVANAALLVDRAVEKFAHWRVNAGQVRLCLVAAASAPEPSPEAIESALLDVSTRLAANAQLVALEGAWLVARVPPSAAPVLSASDDILQTLGGLAADVADLRRESKLAALQPLFVKPTLSTGSSLRSPRDDERAELKARVIDYFALHADDGAGGEPRCFTHLGGEAVERRFATMAHIWPSTDAGVAGLLAGELKLSSSFHADPRNFLVLPVDVHCAFDSGWLLLLPTRCAGGGAGADVIADVIVRASRVDSVVVAGDPLSAATLAKRDWLRSLDGTRLVFRSAARPFMRVLGWRAWTMRGPADDAATVAVEDAAVDAGSVDAEGNVALSALVRRTTAPQQPAVAQDSSVHG